MTTEAATGGSASIGTVIAGRYRLEETVGRGGSATVWRAVHLDLNRPVALKFLTITGGDPRAVKERFLREARIAAAVRHRNVVDINDFGTTEGGRPFMVMELLEGESLATRMGRDTRFAVPEVVRIGARALSGLGAVHDAGIVHRDLKPENVFLVRDADGVYPKLVDFGISRAVEDHLESVVPTNDNVLAGTPQYMSPEQARGLADVDARSDLWAMGVMLYEMLTGTLPYDDDNPGDVIVKILTEEAAPVEQLRPDVSAPIAAVIQKALAKRREDRWSSAREMRQALLNAATRTAVELRSTADSSFADNPSLEPNELMDAVGSAYEPGDSAVMDLNAEDDRATRTDEQTAKLPLHRRGAAPRSQTGVLVLGLTALLGAAVAIAIAVQAEGTSATAEVLPQVGTPAADDDRVSVVTLRRLPAEAAVTLDGRPVRGALLEIPRSGREHVIEVNVPGFEPWQVTHPGDRDRTYEVELVPLAEATTAPEPARPARTRADGLIADPGF